MRNISVDFRPENTADFGPVSTLQWINISDLVVNDEYQRPLTRASWGQIKKIADNFSWSMFSAVFVSPIEGGKYAIVDGQHRTHAALACGMESVPCLIVNIDVAEQARAFAAVNGMVVKVQALHIFHASIAGGDEGAVRLNDLVNSCGFRIMRSNTSTNSKKYGQLYAIGTLQSIIKTYDEDVLAATLLAIEHSEICATHFDHHPSIVFALASGFGRNRLLCKTPTVISDRIDAKKISLEVYLDQANEEAKHLRRSGVIISGRQQLANLLEKELFVYAARVTA